MCQRSAHPLTRRVLFADDLAATSTRRSHPLQPSTSSARCVHPTPRQSSSPVHRLICARALGPRLLELFQHQVPAAEHALCLTSKAYKASQHPSSTRPCTTCRGVQEQPPPSLPKAAVSAHKPPVSPQEPCGPAPWIPQSQGRVRVLMAVPWVLATVTTRGARGGMFVPPRRECRVDL